MQPLSIEIDFEHGRRRRNPVWAYFSKLGEHPKGLWILATTEVWERFSYYGMRALLVLYMNNVLFQPGEWQSVWGVRIFTGLYGTPHDDMPPLQRKRLVQSISSNFYGLYTALVYLTPLPGGYLSDQYFGQRKMVIFGGATMALGHFCLAFHDAFFLGLLLIIIGNGAFKPNVSTQVGRLYADGDPKRTTAFFIFYCGINFGAFLAPIVCGELRQEVGYDAGFTAAGVGMLVGLVIYIAGWRLVPPDRSVARVKNNGKEKKMSFWAQLREHRYRVVAIVSICFLTIPFWGVYEQQGNTIAVYGQDMVNREIGGWTMPTEFLQSINPFMIFALTPLLNALWAWQRKRLKEPSEASKMAIGLLLLSVGYFLLMAITGEEGGRRISIAWLFLCITLYTAGELFLSPIGLTFISNYSPATMTSLLMGVWFFSSFVGNYMAGWLGSYYSYIPHRVFFLTLAVIASSASVIMFLAGRIAMRHIV